MHTVIELPSFIRSAKAAGMTEAEREGLIDFLADKPEAGDLIVGSGGCRKVRWAASGRGKSGSYRVATFFLAQDGVYLLRVLSKSSAANFSDAETAEFAAIARGLKSGEEA